MNYLMLVNKNNRLSKDFKPDNLVVVENRKWDKPNMILLLEEQTYKQFKKMQSVALKSGFDIICDSGYRSFEYQENLLNNLIEKGKDTSYLARPGESEHHTGLAIDIAAYQNRKYVDNPDLLTKEFEWLSKNAHEFGFILRYPCDKENVTGYPYEPWHYRYVGYSYAKIIYENNITLEEYLEKW